MSSKRYFLDSRKTTVQSKDFLTGDVYDIFYPYDFVDNAEMAIISEDVMHALESQTQGLAFQLTLAHAQAERLKAENAQLKAELQEQQALVSAYEIADAYVKTVASLGGSITADEVIRIHATAFDQRLKDIDSGLIVLTIDTPQASTDAPTQPDSAEKQGE